MHSSIIANFKVLIQQYISTLKSPSVSVQIHRGAVDDAREAQLEYLLNEPCDACDFTFTQLCILRDNFEQHQH